MEIEEYLHEYENNHELIEIIMAVFEKMKEKIQIKLLFQSDAPPSNHQQYSLLEQQIQKLEQKDRTNIRVSITSQDSTTIAALLRVPSAAVGRTEARTAEDHRQLQLDDQLAQNRKPFSRLTVAGAYPSGKTGTRVRQQEKRKGLLHWAAIQKQQEFQCLWQPVRPAELCANSKEQSQQGKKYFA